MPKMDLVFRSAILNAEGMLGFAPDPRNTPGFTELGAFITNPVSLLPRTPAEARAAISFEGGVLLHSGFPNPGLEKVLKKYARLWHSVPMPVILHLMAEDQREMEQCLRMLEGADGLAGLELSFRPGMGTREKANMLLAILREWPVIAQLDIEDLGRVLPLLGGEAVTAVSMLPERGRLPQKIVKGQLVWVEGRLYGAAQFPQTVMKLELAREHGIPVIAAGGVTRLEQVEQLLQAGALAVKVDTGFWSGGISSPG